MNASVLEELDGVLARTMLGKLDSATPGRCALRQLERVRRSLLRHSAPLRD
jgi:hypothetical protein